MPISRLFLLLLLAATLPLSACGKKPSQLEQPLPEDGGKPAADPFPRKYPQPWM